MASVAADPSAIAPPLPLPTRSDAAQPVGPSGAFADLLHAAAPAAASQPQSGSTSRADDGSNTAQGAAAPGNATGSADPAGAGAATPVSRNAKNAGSKNTDDQTAPGDSGAPAGNAATDPTVLVGLPLPPIALAPLPNADQTTAAPQDGQRTSADPAQPGGGDGTAQPGDRKDASASDALPAALVAALPNIIPAAVAAAVPAATPLASVTPVEKSTPVAAPLSAALFSASGTSVPAVGIDIMRSSPSEPQTDGPTWPGPKSAAAVQDVFLGQPPVVSAAPPPGELATAVPPAALQATAGGRASDPTGKSATPAPPVTIPAPSGALSPATALAPVNAVPPTPLSAELHVADQPAGNAASQREEGIPFPLPAQIAVRFAAAVHASDGNTSDSGTDIPLGFAGGAGGSMPTRSDGRNAAAIPPSFNPAVPTMQAAFAPPMPAQHITGMPSAVPLAGIPITIIARAEAGEKRFEIRLDPPDLGRIEVQLNVDGSGRATSHLIVDRADTLDLLRRDAPALERALQSAGLTTDEGALQFSLRDQSFAGRDQGAPAAFTAPPAAAAAETDLAPIDTALRRYGPPMGLGGGIDIRV